MKAKRFLSSIIMTVLVAGLSIPVSASEPSKSMTIVEVASSDKQFSILVDAVVKAGLVDALNADGPYTVFAPTNDAFTALFKQLGVSGIDDLSKEQLTPILLYHVVNAKVMASDVKSGDVATLNDKASLNVSVDGSGVMINKTSKVIKTDIVAKNGVIHVIDNVLLPESGKKEAKSSGCGS